MLTTQALSKWCFCSHLHCCYVIIKKLPIQKGGEQDWLNRNSCRGYFWHTITKLGSYQLICRAVCCHNQVKLLKETVIFVRDILNISSYFNHWIQLLGTLEWTLSTLQKDNKKNNKLLRLVRNCHHPETAWKKGMGMKIGWRSSMIKSNGLTYSTYHKSLKQTASHEFSRKFLRFTPHIFVLTVLCPLPPQCWATRILKNWDHCNAQINIGEGKTHTSVSRFLTRIVDGWARVKY